MTAASASEIRREESKHVTTFVLREIVQVRVFVVFRIQTKKNDYAIDEIRSVIMKAK